METLLAVASFGGSVFSTLATFYFWLVRARGERPNLKPYAIDREFFLGASNPQTRQIGFKLDLVVANYSTLPNALIKAKLQLRGRGENWVDVGGLAFDKQTPLPFNLPSLTTVLLRLNGTLSFPYAPALEDGNKTVGNYLRENLAEPRVARIELHSLNDRVDIVEFKLPDAA
jgi:hypothetical protein